MKYVRVLLGTALAAFAVATSAAAENTQEIFGQKRCFPDDFLFGTATAAYQVEGAWNEGGRTPSIWDDFCRNSPGLDCANVADDFYHRYRDDIQLMVATGLQTLRFSISWSRVMNWDALSRKMKPNAPGIAFYHALVDELKRSGITPILTLYHWDLPSELHTQFLPQGWIGHGIIDHYMQYVELVFGEFGSKIDMWTTFNEPWSFAVNGYGTGLNAPGFVNSTTNTYTVAHHVLLAHGRAVKRFRELKKSGAIHDKARIGIALVDHFAYPLNASDPRDVAAAERRIQFGLGWYLSPIVSGKYPDVMRERVGERLPEFTAEESELLKGSYDLFMLNHYASHLVTDCDSETSQVECSSLSPGWERDAGVDELRAPEGARLSSVNDLGQPNCAWFKGYAPGYLAIIQWMHKHDPNADILLTENGWCGNDSVDNPDQLWYFQTYLEQVHRAITEFKIPVIGYTAWSFFDNYEWGSFKPRFGLYYVNFTSTTGSRNEVTPDVSALTRTPRPAAKWFAQLSKTKCLDSESEHHITTEQLDGDASLAQPVTFGVSAVVIAVVVAIPAMAWVVARRQGSRATTPAGEATPLMQRA